MSLIVETTSLYLFWILSAWHNARLRAAACETQLRNYKRGGGQWHIVRTDPVPLSLRARIPMALPAQTESPLWTLHSRGNTKGESPRLCL